MGVRTVSDVARHHMVEPVSLWPNNVRLALPAVKLVFREQSTSARVAVSAAIERLKARGETVLSVSEIVAEVLEETDEWSHATLSKTLRRELTDPYYRMKKLPIERAGYGKYRIL